MLCRRKEPRAADPGRAALCAPVVEEQVRDLVRRHLAGEPVAYLIGEWEFYGLPLDIDRQVLIPRADTETLVDCALPFLPQQRRERGCWICAPAPGAWGWR